jgi:hypothetical protein
METHQAENVNKSAASPNVPDAINRHIAESAGLNAGQTVHPLARKFRSLPSENAII